MSQEIKNKICIVDDDEAIREIYKIELETSGFLVALAKDGEEGLEVIKKEKPDLALVDIMMPKKSGIELVHDVRKDEEISKTKIIVLTNQDDPQTAQELGEHDIKFYIVKAQATPRKVLDMVREALS